MGPAAVAGLAVASGPALLLVLGPARRYLRRNRLLRLTEALTRKHARLLLVKQKQLVVHDGYGNYHLEDWIKHANYFIDSVILREAASRGLRIDDVRGRSALRAAVTTCFLAIVNAQEAAGSIPEDGILSGQHYETLCHNILEGAGWLVTTTPVTGDQGADLIAEAGGRRLIIQCKFHAKPVGNKAVQEAVAARSFHGGDVAAVVSNNAFTRSARQLAEANGVLLLHHEQLVDMRSFMSRPSHA